MDVVVAYLNDDDGEGTSTLVVAYQESIAGSKIIIALRSYQIADGKVVESGDITKSIVSPSAPPVNISLSVGKIQTTTELQSVVMAMGPYNGPFHLYILKAVNGHLDGSTLWTYIGDQSVFSLSHQISAQVLADTGGALAVIDSYKTDTSFEQALYILQVDGGSITGSVTKKWTDTEYIHGYVNAGNLIGLDTWLGAETRYTANLLKDVLMIIEAPPYHSKFRSQYSGNPFVSWSTTTTKDVQVSMSSSSSYTTSRSFGISIGLFSSSFSTTIEETMKKTVDNTYKSEVKFSEQLEIRVSFEDTLLVREISYIVIERPVYIGRKRSGSILVYQPIQNSSNSLSIVSGSYLYYNTSHAVGDVRTYPFGAPTDRNYSIYTDSGTVSFGTQFSFTVTRATMTGHSQALSREQTSKTTHKVDANFPFNVGDISGSIGGSYSDSTEYDGKSVNTSSTQLTEEVQISYSIPGYSTSTPSSSAIEYKVIPYLYWDNAGLFHFSWSVNLPKADWNSLITRPDPALLLPYGADVFKSSRIQRVIFELYITPRTVTRQGESVLIALPIHNYSFKPAINTSIEFFWAPTSKIPPDFSSTADWHHITTEHIPSIGGFLNETVFIPWIPDSGLESAVVIVNVVAGSGGDFDSSNNMGYSVWPQDDGNPFREIPLRNRLLNKDEL